MSIGTGGGGGGGSAKAASSGFDEFQSAAAAQPAKPPSRPVETPVEITFKPKPEYTAEARQQRIQGEVLVDVIFRADGRVEVVQITRGLGAGLDASARAAAARIRFHPGTRDGSPVDMRGTVHIVFELS